MSMKSPFFIDNLNHLCEDEACSKLIFHEVIRLT
jgi:hypothetical protein